MILMHERKMMMKQIRTGFKSRLVTALLTFTLLIGFVFSNNILADTEQYLDEADYLNGLGLFLGGTNGYDLGSMPDRAQGAVMVVRLMGKEAEALAQNYPHPFSDVPDWASPYVGYLYFHGITNGIPGGLYGAGNPLNATQYMTMMLRVIDYDDGAGDFVWNESLEMARDIGAISQDDYNYYVANDDGFLRDDMVHFSYNILFEELNDNVITLYQELEADGVIPAETGDELAEEDSEDNPEETPEETPEEEPAEEPDGPIQPIVHESSPITASSDIDYPYTGVELATYCGSPAELQFAIETMAFQMLDTAQFNVSGVADFDAVVEAAMNGIQEHPGYFSIITRYGYSYTSNRITVELYYSQTPAEVMTARQTADSIISSIITPGMSDYDKEIAIHDYLVNTIRYTQNIQGDKPYTMYGALIDRSAVCQGYAEAFDYLCELAGLDAMVATGTAYQGGSGVRHAWNIVRIDGAYYHVDVTWDDPTTQDGSDVLQYYYFNLTDAEIAKDHVLDGRTYPTCNSTAANYYYRLGMVVTSPEELNTYIRNGFLSRDTLIEVRCVGFTTSTAEVGNILNNNTDAGWSTCSYSVNSAVGIVKIMEIGYH